MREKTKGRVTIPTDMDVVAETLELMERWGADAIRDCDGTEYPQELRDVGAKVYSTYYTTRKDNEWAKSNPDEIQQMYIMTPFYNAEGDTLRIHLMNHLYPDMLAVNSRDDIKRWWEVIDRTTGEVWPAGDWFYEAAGYVYAHGMMRGLSENTFAPYEVTDRAMIVTILHRLEGSPAALPAAFTDVPEGQYYAIPVAWASSVGIVEGYEDATFRPESPITREQLAAILYRYARYKGLDISVRGDLGRFPDAVSVSLYAADAMSWAVGTGLIAGLDGALQPDGAAGRAQVAVILQRMCAGLLQMP